MNKRKKYDIYVHNRHRDYALVYFFGTIFLGILLPNIDRYIINHNKIGIDSLLTIILLIIFGAATIGSYAIMAGKVYVKGNRIKIKKWYGLTRECDIKDVDKIVFDKTSGKIDAVTIYIKGTKILLVSDIINFNELVNFIIVNVDSSKVENLKMTKKLFKQIVKDCDLSSNMYNIDGTGRDDERFCLVKENDRWNVYYSERGYKTTNEYFDEESDALLYILDQFGL